MGNVLRGYLAAVTGGLTELVRLVMPGQEAKAAMAAGIQVGTAAYNVPVPVLYGKHRRAGNVIWCPKEFWHVEFGQPAGKGGASSGSNDQFWQGVAIGLCEGPISGIQRVWADKTEMANLAATDTEGNPFQFFPGSRPQSPWTYFLSDQDVRKADELDIPPSAPYSVQIEESRFVRLTKLVLGTHQSDGTWSWEGMDDIFHRSDLTIDLQTPGGPTLTFGAVHAGKKVRAFWVSAQSYTEYAIGYGGLAYVISSRISLGGSNSLKNWNFETVALCSDPAHGDDAQPADVIADFLPNGVYGAAFPFAVDVQTGQDGTADSSYQRYCEQEGFWFAPAIEELKPALDHLESWLTATNSTCLWREDYLRIVPLCDRPVGTYAPAFYTGGAIAPRYDLDFDAMGRSGSVVVSAEVKALEDTYNCIPVEYLHRDAPNSPYLLDLAQETDQGDAALTGQRTAQPVALHCITTPAHASKISRILTQRSLWQPRVYRCTVGPKHSALEALDYVTLTDAKMGIDHRPVRIRSIEQGEDESYQIEAEDAPDGVFSAAAYTVQAGEGGGQDQSVDPWHANPPVIFTPPLALTSDKQTPELWIATSGAIKDWGGCQVWISWDGGASYTLWGKSTGSTYGVTTASMEDGAAGLDTTNTLSVDVDASGGTLASVSDADRDADGSLCWVDGEVLSYGTATLVSAGNYALTNLVRGRYGTVNLSHPAASQFIRLDGSIVRVPISAARYGSAVHVKLVSYNLAGKLQDPATVSPFVFQLPGVDTLAQVVPAQIVSFDNFDREDWDVYDGSGSLAVIGGEGVAGGSVLRATGRVWLVSKRLIPYDPAKLYKVMARIRQVSGTATAFSAGFVGVLADRVTLCNLSGANSTASQYTMSIVPGDTAWHELDAWWQGRATPGTVGGTQGAPAVAHTNVRYARLLLEFNSGGAGVQEVDALSFTEDVGAGAMGPPGIDALTSYLTAAAASVAGDVNGNVTAGLPLSFQMRVMSGVIDDSANWSFSVSPASSGTGVSYTVSGNTITVTGMAASLDTGELTVNATRASFPTLKQTFTISKSRVGATGAPGSTAQVLTLSATAQAFTYDGSGAASPSSQTISFTAVLQNIAGTATFGCTLYDAIGNSLGPVTLGGSGNTRTLGIAQFGGAAYAVVTASLSALSDQTTVVRLQAGAPGSTGPAGQNAVTGLLTNESVTVAADSNGNVSSWAPAAGVFRVFDGITDKTTSGLVTYSVQAQTNVSISIDASGNYSVSGMSADTGTATLRAVYAGLTIDKIFSIAKSRVGATGAPGSTAQVLTLSATAQAFTYDGSGAASPSSQTISFTAVLQNIAGTATFGCTLYDAIGNSLGPVTLGGSGNTRTLGIAQFGGAAYAVVTASLSALSDQTTVVRLQAGAPGSTGPAGQNAVTGLLTNESVTVAADSNGNVSSWAPAAGVFRVFDGITDKTTSGLVTYSVQAQTNVSISIDASGNYSVSGMSADTGTATLRAVYAGLTIDKIFSIAKSRAGATGPTGGAGARGSMTFYLNAETYGFAYWRDDYANQCTAPWGGNRAGDTVTEYNASAGWAQTKFWTGSAWSAPGLVVDGGLLVHGSVVAASMAADVFQTSNYSETNGIPDHGAKLDHTGTAIKVAGDGLQVGSTNIGQAWFCRDIIVGGSIAYLNGEIGFSGRVTYATDASYVETDPASPYNGQTIHYLSVGYDPGPYTGLNSSYTTFFLCAPSRADSDMWKRNTDPAATRLSRLMSANTTVIGYANLYLIDGAGYPRSYTDHGWSFDVLFYVWGRGYMVL